MFMIRIYSGTSKHSLYSMHRSDELLYHRKIEINYSMFSILAFNQIHSFVKLMFDHVS